MYPNKGHTSQHLEAVYGQYWRDYTAGLPWAVIWLAAGGW